MTLDSEWKDHLLSLDKLRHGINLRAYAQKDPLIEYKRDAFNLFENMLFAMEEKVISRVAHAELKTDAETEAKINLINKLVPKQKMFESRNDPALVGINGVDENKIVSRNPIKTNTKPQDRDPTNPSSWGNVGRNETCPCGSGKKFKNCHGVYTKLKIY
jgi:preprotein translocase subunit SecA